MGGAPRQYPYPLKATNSTSNEPLLCSRLRGIPMPSYIHASKALSASHERQRLLWRTCLPSLARLELPVLMAGTKQARSVANLNLGFLRQLEIFRVLKERRARSIVAGTDASGGEGGEAERGAGAEVGGGGGAITVDRRKQCSATLLAPAAATMATLVMMPAATATMMTSTTAVAVPAPCLNLA